MIFIFNRVSALWGIVLLSFLSANGLTQDVIKMHPQARTDSTLTKEILLEDIYIEAVIEKPSVTLIPKRVEPDIGTIPFKYRSFDEELKAEPEMLEEYGKEFEEERRAQKIKKNVAK